jgi:energy-converting hydrogenase Eha subunit A
MPYIAREERSTDTILYPKSAGQLAWAVTTISQRYIGTSRLSYAGMAIVAGVLILTLFEFVRRVVSPYEDKKIKEHGDVFDETQA